MSQYISAVLNKLVQNLIWPINWAWRKTFDIWHLNYVDLQKGYLLCLKTLQKYYLCPWLRLRFSVLEIFHEI